MQLIRIPGSGKQETRRRHRKTTDHESERGGIDTKRHAERKTETNHSFSIVTRANSHSKNELTIVIRCISSFILWHFCHELFPVYVCTRTRGYYSRYIDTCTVYWWYGARKCIRQTERKGCMMVRDEVGNKALKQVSKLKFKIISKSDRNNVLSGCPNYNLP